MTICNNLKQGAFVALFTFLSLFVLNLTASEALVHQKPTLEVLAAMLLPTTTFPQQPYVSGNSSSIDETPKKSQRSTSLKREAAKRAEEKLSKILKEVDDDDDDVNDKEDARNSSDDYAPEEDANNNTTIITPKDCTEKIFYRTPSNNNEFKKDPKDGRYYCPIENCTNHYTEKHNLRQHIRSIHNQERFQCLYCKEQFLRNNALQNHIISIHTKQFSYYCACGKGFHWKGGLTRHQKRCPSDKKR